MATTNVSIISRALKGMGEETIASLSESSVESETANILYQGTYETLLSEAPWTFATTTTPTQSPLVGAPNDTNWKFKFQEPANALTIWDVIDNNGTTIPFLPEEDMVFTNSDTVRIKYTQTILESKLPEYFIEYLILALRFEFQEEMRSSNTLANIYAQERQRTQRRALLRDAQKRGQRRVSGRGSYVATRLS